MDDITSTEKLLDLIRSKKAGSGPPLLKGQSAPAPRHNIRKVFKNKTPARNMIHVGVDIGHECVRVVKTEKIGSRWDLIDYQKIPFNHIQKGTPEFIDFLRVELKRFCGDYKKISIWAIMSAANVNVRHIKIPKVPKNQIGNAVFWSMKKEAPFNEKESILDYEVLEEITDGGTPKWFVVAYTAPIREIDTLKNRFAKIGLPLTGISIVPFAIQNILRTGWIAQSDGHVATLFLGNAFSRIDIFHNGNMIMTRGIKSGINSMAEALFETLRGPSQADAILPEHREPSEIDMEQARKVLISLNPDGETLTEKDPGYSLTERQKFDIILPALQRLVRQIELTFERYHEKNSPDNLTKLYVASTTNLYPPAISYIGEQLGLETQLIDPFDPETTQTDPAFDHGNLSERITLTPALGMALSDNEYTPNLLFTAWEKQQIVSINRVSRAIFLVLAVLTLICGGAFLYQLGLMAKKTMDISRLQKELARYQPRVQQSELLQMAAKAKQQTFSPRDYIERYRGMAVIQEVAALTPVNIRLVNLKADFGAPVPAAAQALPTEAAKGQPTAEKKTEPPKEPPKGTATAGKTNNIVVEGVITGERQSLEASLAAYLIKLEDSPLFQQVTLQKNSIEQVRKSDALRFTVQMNIAG